MTKVRRRSTPEAVAEILREETQAAIKEALTTAAAVLPADPYLGKRHQRTVVGIDASLTGTAICLYDVDTGEHGAYRLKPKHKGVQRLLEIEGFVYNRLHLAGLTSDEVGHVCMEDYAMGIKGGRTFNIGEGGGAVKMGLVRALGSNRQVAYPTLVSPTALKKFVLGKGVGEKSDMKMQTLKRWGVEFSDDNECDAFGLAQIAALLVREDLVEGAPQYQQEVLTKVLLHAEWEH